MTRFQQLGAFVNNIGNCTNHFLDHFSNAGGRYVHPLLLQLDGPDRPQPVPQPDPAVENLKAIAQFQDRCLQRGIACGIEAVGWGGDAVLNAMAIANVVHQWNLGPIMLNLEASYQYPEGNSALMPQLVRAVRVLCPGRAIFVSTNGMNSASIWNGRTLTPPQSFYDLGIRVSPQWYSHYYNQDNHYLPKNQMKWLRENGATDFNFKDISGASGRGLPNSYVHGTLEVTGLEGSSLEQELDDLHEAQDYGHGMGWIMYDLENTPDSDWPLIVAEQGISFLV